MERALKEYVWLKNGAYLVIQPTEALTVVDVNSGKYSAKTKKKSAETYLKINLEAAKETAQMCIRDSLMNVLFWSMKPKTENKNCPNKKI